MTPVTIVRALRGRGKRALAPDKYAVLERTASESNPSGSTRKGFFYYLLVDFQTFAGDRWLAWTAGLAVIAVLLRFFFWIYAHRTWEDALITVLHSENAYAGLGLTHYHVGESQVHGFTSPLSVLVPLVGDFFAIGFGLSFIKIVSALVSGVAILFAALVTKRLRLPTPFIILVAGYLALEHHQISFGMAGMETQIVVACLMFSFWCLMKPLPISTGVALGLCMLARPDFAIWVGIAGLYLVWQAWTQRQFAFLIKAVSAAALVYGPWLVFATLYYGSPVPNTILAKGTGYSLWTTQHHTVLEFLSIAAHRALYLFSPLGPAFGGHGVFVRLTGGLTVEIVVLLCVLAALVAAWKRRDTQAGVIISFVLAFSVYYVFLVPGIFCWYCVPLAAAAVICAVYGLSYVLENMPRPVAAIVTAVYLAALISALPQTFPGERNIQLYVEDGLRKQIGLYLAKVSRTDETIGCEPLGYISYYSRRAVYDYPGLVSRRVVSFFRDHPKERGLDYMLAHFKPTFLVLRNTEYDQFRKEPRDVWISEEYAVVREFSISPDHIQMLLHPEANTDYHFYILKKQNSGT